MIRKKNHNMYFEDGTIFDPPQNPLLEKWFKLYPPISPYCKDDFERCEWCDKCPYGDNWVVPEEDKEIFEEHMKRYQEYLDSHGGLEKLYLKLNTPIGDIMI